MVNINGWIDGTVLKILQAVGVELPGGDGDVLRSVAQGWDDMGQSLGNRVRELDQQAALTPTEWSGPARQAFDEHWKQQAQTLNDFASNLHKIADGLRTYANVIDEINLAIVDICVQIAEMEAAGFLVGLLTAGIGDLLANAAVAERVAKIVELVERFSAAAEKVGELLKEFFELSEETAATIAKVLGSIGKSFVTNFAADTGSAMANQVLSGTKVTGVQDMEDGATEALGSAAFAGLTGGIAGSGKVSEDVGKFLTGEGGKVSNLTAGALGNISGTLTDDLTLHQDKNGTTVGEDILTAGATGALGNHRTEEGTGRDGVVRGTIDNTGVYNAGSGVESDLQNLQKEQQQLASQESGQ